MIEINAEAQTAQGRRDGEKVENFISGRIKDAAIEVHRILGGPGLLENVYEEALFRELQLRGIEVKRQVYVPMKYKGIILRDPLRIDLLVENKIIIEAKATEINHPIHKSQVLTYLRLTGLRLGLVLNFGQELLINGLFRVVNDL